MSPQPAQQDTSPLAPVIPIGVTYQPSNPGLAIQRTLSGILAAGLPAATAAGLLIQTLMAGGFTLQVATIVVGLAGGVTPVPPELLTATGAATVSTAQSEAVYQAAFLVAVARRITDAIKAGTSLVDAVKMERRYLLMHRAAAAHRRAAAAQVDQAAAKYGLTLGWYLGPVKTVHTPVCIAAAGHDFDMGSRPLPGWPGTSHARCACHAGPPHHSRRTVDEVTRPLIARGLS